MKKYLACLFLCCSLASTYLTRAEEKPKADTGNITELKQTLADVPRDLIMAVRSPAGREAAATKATDVLRAKVEGRMATLKFKIDKIEKDPRRAQNQDGFRVKADEERLREGVTSFRTYLWVHFDLSENPKFAALKKGSEISVTGKVTLASITAPKEPELHIDLSDAKVN